MTSPAPAIELDHLVKTFRGPGGEVVRAVDGLDLVVQPGEVVAFLGPNGAGKTTTLDLVLGLTEPTSGSARVHGQAPRAAVDAGRVSAVLQTGGLLRDLTVGETVRLVSSMFEDPQPVADVVTRAGLSGITDRLVSTCSGGEQQRLRFALALLPDPDLLVLDEPTAGMDVTTRRDFWETMHADADAGRTVVFATHYLEEADAFADRIVMVAQGRVAADGSTEQIRARASGRTVSATLPAERVDAVTRELGALPTVVSATASGTRVEIVAQDSDAVALTLLAAHRARDLEVRSASLEQAFMTITTREDLPA